MRSATRTWRSAPSARCAAFRSRARRHALGICGLALGPVYPVTIALTGRRFPQAVGTASGLVAGAGASGGFCLPWVSGAIGDASSAPFAIAVLGASALLIAIAAFTFARQPA